MINSYNLYIDKLTPEYRESFEKISVYVCGTNADEIRNEEILSEVMDSFLEAQSAGKSVNQITGNLEKFCRDLCSNIGIKSRIINFLEALHPMFIFYSLLCVMDFFDMLIGIADGERIQFFSYRGHSILAFCIASLVVVGAGFIGNIVRKRYVFSSPEKYRRVSVVLNVITVAVIIALIIALFVFDSDDSQSEGSLLWLSIVCCATFIITYRMLTRESRRYRKENRVSFMDFVDQDSIMDDVEKAEMKKLAKINAKRARGGKPALTLDEFIEHEKNELDKWYYSLKFHIMLVIVTTIGAVILTAVTGGFESITDLIIFIALVSVCEAIVMYVLYKTTNLYNKQFLRKWIDSKR